MARSAAQHDSRSLSRVLFDLAKSRFGWGLTCNGLIAVAGLAAAFFAVEFVYLPLAVLVFSVIAELCFWRADYWKGLAEELLGKLDFEDAFGWRISSDEMRDILVQCPAALTEHFTEGPSGEAYFATQEAKGPRRALESVRESAWWSHHLAKRAGTLCLILAVAVVAITIFALVVSIQEVQGQATLAKVSKAVTAALMAIPSLSLLRLTLGYFTFSGRAAVTEKCAEGALRAAKVEDSEAVRIMHDYQLTRAASPLIPTWFWESNRANLNRLWQRSHPGGTIGTATP